MADLLNDIEDFLIGKGIITSAFIDTMNSTPDDAVALYEYAGQTGLAQAGVSNRSVQVVARSRMSIDAKNMALDIYNALTSDNHIVNFTQERWAMVYLRQPPFKLKVDQNERTYYVFNMGVTTYIEQEVF